MTSTLERLARPKNQGAAFVTGLPQVNLLPQEFNDARKLAGLKVRLVIALCVVLGLVVASYFGSVAKLALANGDVAEAATENAVLTQEQHKYAEVPRVLGQLNDLKEARRLGFSTEILWTPYIGAILAMMPEGVQLTTIKHTAATPMQAAAPPTNPLEDPGVGRITFEAKSASLIDTANWVDTLNATPGFTSAWVTAVSANQDEAGNVYYKVEAGAVVTDEVFANRFADKGE